MPWAEQTVHGAAKPGTLNYAGTGTGIERV
jgi:hypothetical protein